jgi:hypothetical protein
MSGHRKHSRRTSHALTWACLVLIPALAIIALGSGLSLMSSGPAAPGGLQIADTRAFAAQGDTVTAVKPVDAGTVDQFMDAWQNTVRLAPSPRR